MKLFENIRNVIDNKNKLKEDEKELYGKIEHLL